MPELEGEARYVTVARLVRVHGNRGELAAEPETDDAGLFTSLSQVHLWDGGDRREPFRIRGSRPHKGRLILGFEGIDTISQAEKLAGWEVQITAEQRPPAPAGRFYLTDLLGCRVEELLSGRLLGEVHAFTQRGDLLLLEVVLAGKELLIPFAATICVDIDMARRLIRVELPEGLEDLNRG